MGLAVNLLLSALKFAGGILGNSQAVVADAVHSLSDCVTDIVVLVGVQVWTKPPDELHPHGHRRFETLITAFIGLMLAAAAMGLGWRALGALHQGQPSQPGWIALLAAAVSLVSKEALYRWTAVTGKRVKSSALMANAWHHRSDALSSIPAFIAVGGALISPSWGFLDHIGAVVVSLFILAAAWEIMKPALAELSDTGASARVCEQLTELAKAVAGVMEVHALRTRYIGGGLQVDLHVLVDPQLTVQEGHAITGAVKAKLLEYGPDVVDVLVHLEPYGEEHED